MGIKASDGVLQATAAVLVLAMPAGLLVIQHRCGRAHAAAALVAGAVGAMASLIGTAVFFLSADVPSMVLDAAFAAAIAASVAVLASHVAAAVSLLALTLLPRTRQAIVGPGAVSVRRAGVASAFVILGASAWMLGAERAVSEASGRRAPSGLVAVVLVAWGATGLGVAFLSPAALITTVVICTAAATAITLRGNPLTDRGRRASVAVVAAVGIGGFVLALLADGFGMSATGSTALVVGQLGAVIVVAFFAGAVGLLCGGVAVLTTTLVKRWAIPDSN